MCNTHTHTWELWNMWYYIRNIIIGPTSHQQKQLRGVIMSSLRFLQNNIHSWSVGHARTKSPRKWGWFYEPGKLWHTREVWERLHHHERRFLSNGQAFNAKVWYVVCSGMITVTPRMGKQMETKSRSMCKVYQNAAWSWGLCGSCTTFWGKILQLPNQQSYTQFGFFLKRSDIPGGSDSEWSKRPMASPWSVQVRLLRPYQPFRTSLGMSG